ncbi:hypothetical protein Ciccas_013145 [Cichlidogyrus casuarinus]|uniref:HAT C-terminal dimerisation domain-containing protein n=1 Tax=Cichlidogyrus casuarinus TaxID=1844966 RepID=A0ABD2PLG6_9PLAT
MYDLLEEWFTKLDDHRRGVIIEEFGTIPPFTKTLGNCEDRIPVFIWWASHTLPFKEECRQVALYSLVTCSNRYKFLASTKPFKRIEFLLCLLQKLNNSKQISPIAPCDR